MRIQERERKKEEEKKKEEEDKKKEKQARIATVKAYENQMKNAWEVVM